MGIAEFSIAIMWIGIPGRKMRETHRRKEVSRSQHAQVRSITTPRPDGNLRTTIGNLRIRSRWILLAEDPCESQSESKTEDILKGT